MHSDAHYAAQHTQHGQRVVLGPLVFAVGIGLTVAEVSGNGDTLYSETTILDVKESSGGDRGVVSVQTRVMNQRGEAVMTFRRKS